jgi:hypothetical protein
VRRKKKGKKKSAFSATLVCSDHELLSKFDIEKLMASIRANPDLPGVTTFLKK